jgi:hypothetical protein
MGWEGMKMGNVNNLSDNLKSRDHEEDLSIDGKKVLIWVLK